MTKQEAKRWVCERIRGSLAAGLVDDEAETLPPADRRRVEDAIATVMDEMARRAGIES